MDPCRNSLDGAFLCTQAAAPLMLRVACCTSKDG